MHCYTPSHALLHAPAPACTWRNLLVAIAVKPLEQGAQEVLALLQRVAQCGGHKLSHRDLQGKWGEQERKVG